MEGSITFSGCIHKTNWHLALYENLSIATKDQQQTQRGLKTLLTNQIPTTITFFGTNALSFSRLLNLNLTKRDNLNVNQNVYFVLLDMILLYPTFPCFFAPKKESLQSKTYP